MIGVCHGSDDVTKKCPRRISIYFVLGISYIEGALHLVHYGKRVATDSYLLRQRAVAIRYG